MKFFLLEINYNEIASLKKNYLAGSFGNIWKVGQSIELYFSLFMFDLAFKNQRKCITSNIYLQLAVKEERFFLQQSHTEHNRDHYIRQDKSANGIRAVYAGDVRDYSLE